jgi:hypothetical protein
MTVLKKSILHNNLPDIQGGEENEYYHLNYEQYESIISGGTALVNIRLSDYSGLTCYQGYAVENSLETEAVWNITKIITTNTGNVISSIQTENYIWNDRYNL